MQYWQTEQTSECDNSSSRAGRVVSPQCWKGRATKVVEVVYNEVEKSNHDLCNACAKALVADAKRHGYSTTTRGIVS